MNTEIEMDTLETYKNDSVKELRVVLFLTKVLKNMHTSAVIFCCSLCVALIPVSIFYFMALTNSPYGWTIFPVAAIVQIILHETIIMNYLFKDAADVYNEQAIIQQTLEGMLKNKLESKK